jgi:pimeloyl-ACP methyl ester carboxylesterase
MILGDLVDGVERMWMHRRRRGEPRDGTQVVEVGAARLRVRVVGHGAPTIVLAPDPPNVIEHLRELADTLSDHHRVVCVEMPGFGFSTAPAGFDFSVDQNTRILAELLEVLGYAPYALALPCLAGLVGATVAARHSGLVSHFIGVQTPGLEGARRWVRRVDRRGVLRRDGLGQAVVLATRRRLVEAWFDVALADASRRGVFVTETLAAYAEGATYPLASALQGVWRMKTFTSPTQPMLLVWGGSDRTHRGTSRDELRRGASVVTLESAGHFPDLEDVPGFSSAVTTFLRETRPSA